MGNDFGQMVSDATGGAVTVEVYASDQLTSGSQTEGIQGVIDGTIELSAHSNIIYSNFDARLNVVSLPFLFDSYDDVDAKLDGDAGKAVGEVVESMGLHLLGIAENGFRHPTNSVRPIESLADMKGLKLRVAGSQLLNAEYEAWGANWTNANWSEVYTGLQTGTYDGQENPLPTADGASISDVQKYVTYWTGVYDCIFFTMNGELYDSLSPELQAIVDECGQKAAQNQRELERQGDQEVLEKWKNAGITVTELSDDAIAEFKEASASIYTDPTFVDMIGQDLIDAFTK
jgi:C4-dicarboxylate transporter DctM subunit